MIKKREREKKNVHTILYRKKCIKKNGAQGVHKVAQGQNSKNQGAQGLGDPSPHKAAQGFFQYFCLVLRLVRALCGHSLLSLCKQGARFVEVWGGSEMPKKPGGRFPCCTRPAQSKTKATQPLAQGARRSKIHQPQLHKAAHKAVHKAMHNAMHKDK